MSVRTIGAIVLVLALGYGLWVGNAPSAEDPTADAVVVHAGGRNDRLPHALDLMAKGAAPTLVIMRGDTPTWTAAQRLCGTTEPFEVVCPFPDPDTTIGEARRLRELVEARDWSSVVTVTSDYHLRRATLLDARCNPGLTVLGSASESDLPLPLWLARVAREMAGMLQAVVVQC